MKRPISLLFLLLPFLVCTLLNAEEASQSTVLSVGGRVQLDTIVAWPEGSFYAGKIPLKKDTQGESGQLSMNIRDSRLWFKTRTPSQYGVVRTLVETDFWGGTTNANEKNTNSYGLRLRHAYINVAGWTVGQTNSAFNSSMMLDTITHVINETFVRQPLIRYSIKESESIAYDISFEQPETTLINSSGSMITPQDDLFPDIILRARFYPSWGEVALATMGRYIAQDRAEIDSSSNYTNKDSALAYATNFTLQLNSFGYDDIRFDAQYGLGIGRYLAYSAFAAGSIDDNGAIKLQESYGAHLGYRHWWSRTLRSTLAISYAATNSNLEVIRDSGLEKATKSVKSLQFNLLYSPIKKSLVGFEYTKGLRRVQSNDEGVMDLITLVCRYNF